MTRRAADPPATLHRLARLHNVQTAYYDIDGRRRTASPASIRAILLALGVTVDTGSGIEEALRVQTAQRAPEVVDPVTVAWDGRLDRLEISLPDTAPRALTCRLHLEDGRVVVYPIDTSRLRTVRRLQLDGQRIVTTRIRLQETVPIGYHRLTVETPTAASETLVIAAPSRVFQPAAKTWGVFLPLYALRTTGSWGAGDLSDLERLHEWTASAGGSVVATLPFLASFNGDELFEPSPYAPASRLFWNELFIDPRRAPELTISPDAVHLIESSAFRSEVASLQAEPLVDHGRVMRLKRRVLEPLARSFYASSGRRRAAFREWATAHPEVGPYARFRAVVEKRREPWTSWPARLRDGRLDTGDVAPDVERYHTYVQWLADEQVGHAADEARAAGGGLYLDMPLGVHPHGFDPWRHQELFAKGISVGAPPDPFITRGQDWGFPPLHPEAIRRDRYRYPIACLRHQLARAGLLRLDHVMALHRLFWIPSGLGASNGAYVRYRADEWYAIVSLESHRSKTLIVGENLGTVPSHVNRALSRHGVGPMYVLQFDVDARRPRALTRVARGAVASLNTHDMPTFTAFLRGLDIEDRVKMGLLTGRDGEAARRDRIRIRRALLAFLPAGGEAASSGRDDEEMELLTRCLIWLAESPAGLTLVNLEDLWKETMPQNRPGTGVEYPNWRRKARYAFEDFRARPETLAALARVATRRLD